MKTNLVFLAVFCLLGVATVTNAFTVAKVDANTIVDKEELWNSRYDHTISTIEKMRSNAAADKNNVQPSSFAKDDKVMDFSPVHHELPKSNASCDMCMHIAPHFWDMWHNATATRIGTQELDHLCEYYLAKNGTKAVAECKKIATEFMNFAHWGIDRVWMFHFNLSAVLCADILNVCTWPCCTTPDVPEQIHLSYPRENTAANPLGWSEMQVTWVTLKRNACPQMQYRLMENGTTAAGAWITVSNVSQTTYTWGNWMGRVYSGTMEALFPGTAYEYRIAIDTNGSMTTTPEGNGCSHVTYESWTEPIVFKTLPGNVGTPERPLRVVSTADMGFSNWSTNTVNQMEKLVNEGKIDLFVHTGDLSYADGDQARFDMYMRKIQPIASRIPYMTTPGNHEALWNFSAYKARFFSLPKPEGQNPPPGSDAMYYSFSVGRFFFLMLDSETWYDMPRMDPVQVAWATTKMEEAAERKQMIFVGFHRPMYCSNPGPTCTKEGEFLRSRLEPAFLQTRVSIVHTGHVHDYERSVPVANATIMSTSFSNPPAPVHVLNGAGGSVEGISHFPAKDTRPWTASASFTEGYGVFEFSTDERSSPNVDTHEAKFTFFRAMDNKELDFFNVTRVYNKV